MVTLSFSCRKTTLVDTTRLKDVIRNNIRQLAGALYPNGKFRYGEWRIGNLNGDAGDSLGIQLTGDKVGLWHDRATGEGGDFIDLLRAKFRFGFKEAVEWIERTLGISLQSAEAGERKGCGPVQTQFVRQPEPLSCDPLRRMAAAAHRLVRKPEFFNEMLGPRPEIGLDAVRGSALDGDLGYEADCRFSGFSGPAILFGYTYGVKARWQGVDQRGKRKMRWLAGAAGGQCWRQSLLRHSHCAHRTLYITEGETDALALLSLGVEDHDEHCLVVGLPGATTLPKPEPFSGLEVIILPDTDGPGQASARKLAELLSASARVSISNLNLTRGN
jgi:hypothetical protein